MRGSHLCWPSDWAVGRSIKLLECTFSRTSLDQTQNLAIEVEVDAQNADRAMDLGKEIISKEFDLFELCVENPLHLDENYISSEAI